MHHARGRMKALRALPSWILALAIGALICAVYAAALDVGFFSDDLTWLARMDATRANPQFLLTVFGRDFTPLFHLSLLVDYLLAGTESWMFHASSIVLHAARAAMLFGARSRATRSWARGSRRASSAFAPQPWISCRA